VSALSLHTLIWLIGLLALFSLNALVGVYWERKVIGHVQGRHGPLHHGWHGLLQLPADMVKMISKEDIVPTDADPWLFQLAPMMALVPALTAFVALTFQPGAALLDMHHGVLFILALESVLPLAFALVGWSCSSKYTLLGGLRAAAQLISYEMPLLLAALGVVLTAGSMRISDIVAAQSGGWNVLKQPIGFVVFCVAVLAEMNRTPFDLPEAESELVSGYMTEYSGMKFGLVQLSEYSITFVGSYLVAVLYLGGWTMPFLPASWVWVALKTLAIMTSTMWIRGTFPRLRVDTLMALGWKWLLPAALVNVMLVATLALLLPRIS
jgi:NADH-quinone oxidoreductase subunit H